MATISTVCIVGAAALLGGASYSWWRNHRAAPLQWTEAEKSVMRQLEAEGFKKLDRKFNNDRNFVYGKGSGSTPRIISEYFIKDRNLRGVAKFGEDAEGMVGCAHGGAIAALADSFTATIAYINGHRAVTGNLNVNYRAVMKTNQGYRLAADIDKVEGRKATVSYSYRSLDNETLHAEGSALFIIPKQFTPVVAGVGDASQENLDKAKNGSAEQTAAEKTA